MLCTQLRRRRGLQHGSATRGGGTQHLAAPGGPFLRSAWWPRCSPFLTLGTTSLPQPWPRRSVRAQQAQRTASAADRCLCLGSTRLLPSPTAAAEPCAVVLCPRPAAIVCCPAGPVFPRDIARLQDELWEPDFNPDFDQMLREHRMQVGAGRLAGHLPGSFLGQGRRPSGWRGHAPGCRGRASSEGLKRAAPVLRGPPCFSWRLVCSVCRLQSMRRLERRPTVPPARWRPGPRAPPGCGARAAAC